MSLEPSLQRLLLHAQKLLTLSGPDEILAASCAEALALTGAERAFASFCLPGKSWDQGTHIAADRSGARAATDAARSALFAVHRKLALRRATTALDRTAETTAIFRGLGCADGVHGIDAIPVVHRTGRLWGELVLIGAARIDESASELARLATAALESSQRLAFARRDQDRLLLLAEATDDALYDWHFDTRDFWWGGGIVKLLGSETFPEQHSGHWKLDRIHPDDADGVRTSLDETRRSRATTWSREYRFRRHDDSYIHVEDRGYLLRDVTGHAYRMIGSMRDVTALKELLEREQQARADAERANRAKDEFLAMLGHELRNPLAPIVTGLQLLRLRDSTHAGKELEVLERQAQHLIRLVDDLLDISRIAHAKIELKKERIEIATAIAAAIESAGPLLESRQHVLDVRVPPRGLEVDADRGRLAQAVGNVLNNAAKYTEPGGRITITASRDGETIVIAVRDNGIGVSPEILPAVFSMFVQERQALDRSQGGLGLGLSIVRNLVELHGGTIEARSEGRGMGSEFTIRIPAARSEAAAGLETPPAARAGSTVGRRILVVDDNEDAADLLSTLLEHLGNTTRVAHDGPAALRVADEFAPELAILDIGLPAMDGYELARRLRDRPGADLHLIALTGYGQSSDKEQALAAGFEAHLVKPIAIDALESVIGKLLAPGS